MRKILLYLMLVLSMISVAYATASPNKNIVSRVYTTENGKTVEWRTVRNSKGTGTLYIVRDGCVLEDVNIVCSYEGNNEIVHVTNRAEVIGAEAFRGNKTVKMVYTGDYVIDIWPRAFQGCTNLETVVIGKNVRGILQNAFFACPNLKYVELQNPKLKEDKFYPWGLDQSIIKTTDELKAENRTKEMAEIHKKLQIK